MCIRETRQGSYARHTNPTACHSYRLILIVGLNDFRKADFRMAVAGVGILFLNNRVADRLLRAGMDT